MDRKFKREQLKQQYAKFAQAWRDEKRFQNYLIENQGAEVKNGEIVGPDGEKVPVLGKKPTFAMWVAAKKNQQQALQAQSEKKVEVEDLSWEEEQVRQN